MMNPCTICTGFFHAIFPERSPTSHAYTLFPATIGASRGRLRQSASSRECASLAHKKNGTQLVPKLSTVSLFLTFLTAVRPHRSRSAVCFLHVFHILENIAEIKCSEVVLRSLRPADHLDTAVFLEKKLRAL